MEIKPNMIIRCRTYEEALELCKKVIKNKPMIYILNWAGYWSMYKSATCYQVNGECDGFYFYGDTDAFRDKEIILYSDLFNETTDNKEVLPNMSKVDLTVFVKNKTIDEFIENLIGRLEEIYNRNDKAKKEAYEEQDWERFDLFTHRNEGVYTSISIVNQLAEEMKK